MNDTATPVLSHSAFEVRIIGGRKFIAIRQHDTENSSWHIVGQNGDNYGAWATVGRFVSAYVAAQTHDDTQLQATPIGVVRLSLRHLS